MRPTVLVDLDDVLADYSQGWQGIEKIGDPLPGAVAFTHALHKLARVVIYTTRCKEYLDDAAARKLDGPDPDRRPKEELAAIVKGWLDKHGFAYDEIYTGQGKPFATCIIDDRAINCQPRKFGWAYRAALDLVEIAAKVHEDVSGTFLEHINKEDQG